MTAKETNDSADRNPLIPPSADEMDPGEPPPWWSEDDDEPDFEELPEILRGEDR